jgi:Kef-type K+ transport system membrane component KefB
MVPNIPSLPLTEADWLFAVLLGLVFVVPLLAERVRVPPIVGLVVAGAVVGPGMLGLIERDGAVGVLGTVGLLYLMFLAGLELDLDEFSHYRRDSLRFGVLTFVVPMALGIATAATLGFSVLAAILIASCWASHTLLTYPVFRRHGTIANRAVATSVGATIITDTAALIVLVVVARAHQGSLSAVFWASLIASLAGLAAMTLWLMPLIGRWVFARYAHEQGVRFVFVLAALFTAAALAHLAGVEPIIGAFLAGLALNRLVPNGSRLMDRIEFVGSNLLIPLFLLSVGMLIDVRLLANPRTLLMAVVFTTVAVVSKGLAAAGAGISLGYGRVEIGTMFSLSAAQAAATLAAVVVGLQVGLIDADVVNAVVLVILVTCLLTSWSAGRLAPRLHRPTPRRPLGSAVVLPVVRAETVGPLTRFAAAIAHADGGVVVPVTVGVGEQGVIELESLRAINLEAEQMARLEGVEAEGIVRLDGSASSGVLNSVIERHASAMLIGWHHADDTGDATSLGSMIDHVVSESPVPVLVARLGEHAPVRVVVAITKPDTTPAAMVDLGLALNAARHLAGLYGVPLAAVSVVDDPNVMSAVTQTLGVTAEVDPRTKQVVLAERTAPDDLLVVPVRCDEPPLRCLDRLGRAAGDRQVVAAISGVAVPESHVDHRHRGGLPVAPVA